VALWPAPAVQPLGRAVPDSELLISVAWLGRARDQRGQLGGPARR
jgi:hypothetical protein